MKNVNRKTPWIFTILLAMAVNANAQQPKEFCVYGTTIIHAADTANMISSGYVKNNFDGDLISFVEIKMRARSENHQIDTLVHLKLELEDMKLPDSVFITRDIESQKMFELDALPGNVSGKKTFRIKDDQHTWLFYTVATNWFTDAAQEKFVKENNYDPELIKLNLHDTIIDYAAYHDRNNETGDWSDIKPQKLTIDYNVNGLRDVALLYPDTTLYLKFLEGSYIAEREVKYGVYMDAYCRRLIIERKTNNSPSIRNLNTGYVFRLFSESAIREAMEAE